MDRVAGLADGVGSWIESGVDAGIFARELMGNCEVAAKQIAPSKTAPMSILKNGFYDTKKMVRIGFCWCHSHVCIACAWLV